MGDEKVFSTTLILDFRNGNFKAMKRPPKHFKPNEIPIDVKIKVTLPDEIRLKAEGEIKLNSTQINDIVLEAL